MVHATGRDFQDIPVIDISPLHGPDKVAQARVADALGRAARDVGFLYVTGSGIDERLLASLLAVTKDFFAQPFDKKMEVYIGRSRNHRGYVPEGEEVFYSGTKDKKEAFDMSLDLPADDPDYRAGNPMLGPNQWPDLPGFAEAANAYYKAVFALGRTLMRGFAMALGEQPDCFDRFINKPPCQLRLIHYPFDADAKDATGIGAHTDYECFTLLRSTAPGLEVMNGAGKWIDAPPLAGAYVVNIGDLLEVWTNGQFVATSHRVRKVQEERYSFPLFFTVDYDTVVAPIERFVTEESPARPSVKSGEHLYAQTLQSFTYQKQRLARGEIKLPNEAAPLSSFGQEALQRPTV
jgi:isopenicillin N synthase-like dioxygenase